MVEKLEARDFHEPLLGKDEQVGGDEDQGVVIHHKSLPPEHLEENQGESGYQKHLQFDEEQGHLGFQKPSALTVEDEEQGVVAVAAVVAEEEDKKIGAERVMTWEEYWEWVKAETRCYANYICPVLIINACIVTLIILYFLR